MGAFLVGVAAVAGGLSASPAGAATLTATYEPESSRAPSATFLHYRAASAEVNNLTVDTNAVLDTLVDPGALILDVRSPGPLSGIPPTLVCVAGVLAAVCVDSAEGVGVLAELGPGNDRGIANGCCRPVSVVFDPGPGNDIAGGGSAGETVMAGPGADALRAGGGRDFADYFSRTTPQTISLDGVANDGDTGEQDNVAQDVDVVFLGTAGDTVVGNDLSQVVVGFAGGDHISVAGGSDTLQPGAGADVLDAGAGDDRVSLGSDGSPDQVSCGAGVDTVSIDGPPDPTDTIDPDCEVVD